jgi:competence protein ComEC
MQNPLSKTPFMLLLIPLICGILLQYYLKEIYWSIIVLSLGITVMLFSYFISSKQQFRYRWFFGLGALCFLIAVGMVSTFFRQEKVEFDFNTGENTYKGVVIDIPQKKPRTIAYKVRLADIDKQIVCYFQLDSLRGELKPGDEFIFDAAIQPFRNMGNPDDFDYEGYMYNKGYVGSAYVASRSWMPTGSESSSLKIKAQHLRQKMLSFYGTLSFTETEYSILSALTLGYQDALSDDIKQSFRTTGTAHVLAVSGLHVGIIYLIISFLLGFIKKHSRIYWLKPVVIIFLLWLYAFITGLSPSVVRASIMLSVFCVSEIVNRKGFTLNTLYLTAFFMLLYNPFSLFDVGFQLSFTSVLAILYLHPKAVVLLDIKNKPLKYIWQMFTLSMVAQLATFPLCLYYFGTFPTYFFITNLLIVPLVSLIVYATAGIFIAKILTYIVPMFGYYIYYLPVKILQILVGLLTSITEFFERLPYAQISGVSVSSVDLILIILLILTLLIYLMRKQPKYFITALGLVVIMLGSGLYRNLSRPKNELLIYNRWEGIDIRWTVESKDYIWQQTEDTLSDELFDIKGRKLLILTDDNWCNKQSEKKIEVNWLLLAKDNAYQVSCLTEMFVFDTLVLSNSLSNKTIRQIVNDSQKLGITCYDMNEKGAYSLIF